MSGKKLWTTLTRASCAVQANVPGIITITARLLMIFYIIDSQHNDMKKSGLAIEKQNI